MSQTFGSCGQIVVQTLGGGTPMFMPSFSCRSAGVGISTNSSNENISTEAGFYTAIEADHTTNGFESATLSPVSNTLEQTIVDTGSGKSGILTSVMSPRSSAAASIMTIRVTIDGIETLFTRIIDTAGDHVMILGVSRPWLATSDTLTNAGYNEGLHVGYFTSNPAQSVSLLTPFDSVTLGLNIGMIFKDSLKITVQCDSNLTAGSATHKAIASWLNYIPAGLE